MDGDAAASDAAAAIDGVSIGDAVASDEVAAIDGNDVGYGNGR